MRIWEDNYEGTVFVRDAMKHEGCIKEVIQYSIVLYLENNGVRSYVTDDKWPYIGTAFFFTQSDSNKNTLKFGTLRAEHSV
jgi:hypothetical protein